MTLINVFGFFGMKNYYATSLVYGLIPVLVTPQHYKLPTDLNILHGIFFEK
jgi:hypothetical protein